MTTQELIATLTKEFETTKKVLRAYPADQLSFAPHERSNTAKRLIATFVFEMYLLKSYVFGETVENERYATYDRETLDQLLADFESETNNILTHVQTVSEEDIQKTVAFAGRTFRTDEFIMMMLHDQIHHRGQLSVYIRLAGGKVPSIYGPSADDSSTNL